MPRPSYSTSMSRSDNNGGQIGFYNEEKLQQTAPDIAFSHLNSHESNSQMYSSRNSQAKRKSL